MAQPCAGLIDDDFSMELLVLGNIVALHLPVLLVYRSLWQPVHGARGSPRRPGNPSRGNQPMRITFRLQVRLLMSSFDHLSSPNLDWKSPVAPTTACPSTKALD